MDDKKLINQPRDLKVALYPHQLKSVWVMEDHEENRSQVYKMDIYETDIGFLSDAVGYGKTLSMVSLVLRDRMVWDMSSKYTKKKVKSYGNNCVVRRCGELLEKINCTLILVNKSLVDQWKSELDHTPLKVKYLTSAKNISFFTPCEYDVVVVTQTTYNALLSKFVNCCWKRFIYDEPGSLKVSSMRNVYAGFHWFVTSTPKSIVSLHRSCRSSWMYNFINKDEYNLFSKYLPLITVKNTTDYLEKSWIMPKTTHHYWDCYQNMYKNVMGFVNPTVLRMIGAGNIEGAIRHLGGSKTSHVVDLVRRKKMEELEEILSKIKIYNLRCDEKKIKKWTVEKEKVDSQLIEIDNRFREILTSDCSICYETISKPVMDPSCHNIFCGECILKWCSCNDTCPLCRSTIDPSKLVYIETSIAGVKKNSDSDGDEKERLDKCSVIKKLFRKNKNSKFLIFSEWDKTFSVIKRAIGDVKIATLKGTSNQMTETLNDFRNGDCNILFLNSHKDGSGLNLPEVTDIIIYHKMDTYTQSQIIGRATRIGRSIPLNVHHLISV